MATDWTNLRRRLRRQGFRIERRTGRSAHLRVTHPDADEFVVMPTTPGRGRAFQNQVAQLKKIGYKP